MSVLLDDIATALTDEGEVGGATGWAVFKMMMPDTPNKAVLIQMLEGSAPDTRFILDEPRFMIMVRGDEYEYEEAQTKIESIIDTLHSCEAVIGSNYVFVNAENSGYTMVNVDSKRRMLLSMTFKTMRDG